LNLFYHPDLAARFQLSAEEAHHAIKVLRHQTGDEIELTDGKGHFARARISQIKKEECHCELISKQAVTLRKFFIHLAIAPTKNSDRMEWMLEKCTELGIDRVSFINCQHSERKKINLDRLQKVTLSAMKQSRQAWLPSLATDVPIATILKENDQERFIAYVDDQNPDHLVRCALPKARYLILVGPEGDFSEGELAEALRSGFRKVSLGPNRLRTETAGIAACHILNIINQ
jgi:16S rRNA (uracil1498-N3)-methyltransferase